MILASVLLFICFAAATWQRYEFGVAVFFALLPTYLVRFSIGPVPTTLLELLLFILVGIGLYRYSQKAVPNKWVTLGTALFLLGATVGVLAAVNTTTALGTWKAFYVEPVLLAYTLYLAAQTNTNIRNAIFLGITLSAASLICFTIWQVTSGGILVPSGFWQPDGSFRATGWYGFPNGVGIVLGLSIFPILNFIQIHSKSKKHVLCFASVMIILTLLVVYLAKSTGPLIGILAGVSVLCITHHKTHKATIIFGIIGTLLFLLLPMQSSVKQELLLQDRSGQIRTHMWAEAWALLQDRPVLGAGMASYEKRIVPYHTTVHGEGIEIFHHPHNLFLTLWVNTGIIGLIGFVLTLSIAMYHATKKQQWYLLAFFTAFVVMGLVDSPYIKNDWSILYWGILILTFLPNPTVEKISSET